MPDLLQGMRKRVINSQLESIGVAINNFRIEENLEHEMVVRLNDIIEILKMNEVKIRGMNK